jgi:hypothetical protein
LPDLWGLSPSCGEALEFVQKSAILRTVAQKTGSRDLQFASGMAKCPLCCGDFREGRFEVVAQH